MLTFGLDAIQRAVVFSELIDAMRAAVVAQSRGECDTPMPMHLSLGAKDAEVHIKSSARRGGEFFALKAAGTFPRRPPEGGPPSNGMMLLCSAVTGDPVAFFLDGGWMTDVRTAAVSAMAARELRRRDEAIGILGHGRSGAVAGGAPRRGAAVEAGRRLGPIGPARRGVSSGSLAAAPVRRGRCPHVGRRGRGGNAAHRDDDAVPDAADLDR